MFLSFQKLSLIYIISLTCQAAWANKFHCWVQPPLQLTSAFIEKLLNSTCHFMKSPPAWVRTLHTPPASQAGKKTQVYMSDSLSEKSAFILLSWPNPWILLPALHMLFPTSSLSGNTHFIPQPSKKLLQDYPFTTKQFHPFLDRASTSSLTCVIWSKVLIKSAWQNLSFITWCCLLLLDLLQTSLPRSEPRNCLICYTTIHNCVTLRPVDFISTTPPQDPPLWSTSFFFSPRKEGCGFTQLIWLCIY